MALPRFSLAELRKLPPEERIKRLRQIEQQALAKELDISKEQIEAEIAAAEELIKQSEIEIEEELEEEEELAREPQEEEEEASLEERLEGVRRDESKGYALPDKPYEQPLHAATQNLERLYTQDKWSEQDQQLYKDSKETIEHAMQANKYETFTDRMEEELGTGAALLNKFKYKH